MLDNKEINKLKKKCPSIGKLSNGTPLQVFIKHVFSQFSKIRPMLKQKWINLEIIWQKINYQSIKSTLKNELPNKIKSAIDTKIKYCVEYQIRIGEKKIIFHIYSVTKEKDEIVKKKIILMCLWLTYILSLIKNQCSSLLNIYLFFLPNKKSLPYFDHQYLDTENVNTAFTFCCKPNNEIVIFRDEEWFKVFIHETFHSFGVDFAPYSQGINEKMKEMFGIKINYDLTESWCETWARLFNVIIISYFENNNFNQYEGFKKSFNKRFTDEVIYSIWQMQKIILFYKLDLKSILQGKQTKEYQEGTPVFSYFVLTSLNLLNINEFIIWCNGNNKPIFNFGYDTKKLEKYVDFLKKIVVLSLTNSDLDCIANHSKTQTKKNKSLRMTINEINIKN